MAGNIFQRIQRMIAVAGGNFETMFRDAEFPPLPAAATSLITEINRPDPDMNQIIKVISASPEISAKLIQTINSSLFALRTPVLSVRHAVSLLGLRHIRPIALSFALAESVPRPSGDLFDHEAFWSDSLVKAMRARCFAARYCPGEKDEAFTAMLIADVALPVLLSSWQEFYEPVITEWRSSQDRLSKIERRTFRWDHAQAGASILQQWKFPQELVCFVGVHNLSPDEIRTYELEKSSALPVAVAAQAPSGLRPDPDRAASVMRAANDHLRIPADQLPAVIEDVRICFEEIRELFALRPEVAARVLDLLEEAAQAAAEGTAA